MKNKSKDVVIGAVALVIFIGLLFFLINSNEENVKNVENSVDNNSTVIYDKEELIMNYKITEGSESYHEVEKGDISEDEAIEKLRLEVEEEENRKKLNEIEYQKQLKLQREKELALKVEAEKKAKVAQETAKKNTYASDWITFNGSYFTAKCNGCSGITAYGIDVRKTIYYKGYRIVAADPKIVPLGSIVEIQTPHETFTAFVGDKGGAIKGYKLDILVADKKTAYSLGRHDVKLRVISYAK